MFKRLIRFSGALALGISISGFCMAQDMTTKTTVVQQPDGSYTIIEYPTGKEVLVNLTPTTILPTAKGTAKIVRMSDRTMIHLDLTGLPSDTSKYNLYAVEPSGKVTMISPIEIKNGIAVLDTMTPLNQFMLVLSPEENLSSMSSETKIVLRSAVPSGFSVIPVRSSGEKVAAISSMGDTSGYNVPMLNIPSFRRGTDSEVKIKFMGALTGVRANVSLEPRKDGPTTIKMRFHEMKAAPAGQVFVVWAVSPDNKFVKLGQVVNTGLRNEAEIQTETALQNFGLFVTLEDEQAMPKGVVVATVNP